ncbi:putative F-box protein At1g49610 isoform X1 [Solanum tuberosum]|uniref:F-box family protein n=1 Tax=Solanum tuberosum TaxID=4113 RepID=M1A706_SOLTU|nr:PREDICTED: putative F-box protein At1g49610 isoform X1 [Solanum tuberosum]
MEIQSPMKLKRLVVIGRHKKDRISDLPDAILLHILSMVPDGKQVVRTSVLGKRWRSLWMSVPMSIDFNFPQTENLVVTLDYLSSTLTELHYCKSCDKIPRFTVGGFRYEHCYAKYVDLWVSFATKVAKVEEFLLGLLSVNDQTYDFPSYAFKNSLLKDLELRNCQLNPRATVDWTNLSSLKIGYIDLTDDAMEKILSGSPNLKSLELDNFSGLQRLEINSVKLTQLMIESYYNDNDEIWLEIVAPHLQHLEVLELCSEIRIGQRNVPSLVTAIFRLNFNFENEEQDLEMEFSCLKELLHSVAHVQNLELGTWCIECVSILELKGWRPPPSSRKFLELNLAVIQLDFPGIYSFLQSSSDLETLIIGCWYNHNERNLLARYTDEDELSERFEKHNVKCSFSHLKTITINNFSGSSSENKFVLQLVKYLLKHAAMLKEFVIASTYQWMSPEYRKMAQKLLSFPMSSPHASVVFSDI